MGAADHVIALRPAERINGDGEFVGDIEIQGRDLPDRQIDVISRKGTWIAVEECTAWDKAASRANRDELIFRLHTQGLSNRAIAEKVGCSEGTVRNVLARAAMH